MISNIFSQDVCNASANLDPENLLPIRIKLYKKTAEVYQALHKNRVFDNAAEEYSNLLRDYMEDLWKNHQPAYVREREICSEIISVWQLFEILYFPRDPNTKPVINALMEWQYQTFKASYWAYDVSSIFNEEFTLNHPDFWPYSFRLALLGKLNLLNRLIKHVLNQIQPGYPSLVPIFTAIEEYIVDRVEPDSNDYIKWQMYQAANNHIRQALQLMALLRGDVNTIFEHAQNEIEALVTSLYYNIETIDSIYDYTKHIMKGHNYQPSVYYYFLVGDMYRALEHCTSLDWWLLAHMSDVLKAHNMLDAPIKFTKQDDERNQLDAKDYFVSYYASRLFCQYGLPKEAMQYLLKCGDTGKEIIIHLIDGCNNVEESAVDEMVDICTEISLKEYGLKLYGKAGDQCMASKKYVKAIEYYYQALEYKKIESVFIAILEYYAVSGRLIVLDKWGAHFRDISTGPCSEIYYKLLKYTKLKDDDFTGLTKQYIALVSTISEDTTPNWIKPILYLIGMRLLEDDPIHFDLVQLLYLKKLWKDLKNTMDMNDYKWLVYYLRRETNDSTDTGDVETKNEDPAILKNAMTVFFDTTAVSISQAIERIKSG